MTAVIGDNHTGAELLFKKKFSLLGNGKMWLNYLDENGQSISTGNIKEAAVADELLEIIVSPKSSRSELVIDALGNIRAYLNSPPVEGRANEECVALLSRVLGVPKSGITIRKGQKGRKKLVAVDGLSPERVMEKIRGGG